MRLQIHHDDEAGLEQAKGSQISHSGAARYYGLFNES